jgi:hypothetical protein
MPRRITVSHQAFIALACMEITAKAAGTVENTNRQATGAGTTAAESTARRMIVVRQKFNASACMGIMGQAGGTMADTMR